MAPGDSRPRCSLHWNLPHIDYIDDELARDSGLTNGSHLDSTSPAPFCNPTLGLTLVPALIPTLVPIPALVWPSSDELFRQFMKAYLEIKQGLIQPPAESKQSFKAKVVEVYYSKLHMDCYHFY